MNNNSLVTHLRNFSNTVEQKNLRITTQKGTENNFILSVSSHPQEGTAQGQVQTLQIGRDHLAEKGKLW